MHPKITTLAELKKTGYTTISIKQELRKNLIALLKSGKNGFEGIYGYDDTVIPELQTAILSNHNILLLGLRGQAKTRLARLMVNLLDEYIPYIQGSELYDCPLNPISYFGKTQIETLGDKTPIAWLHRSERYTEKLATPDVTVSDLIGDIDPIKAANQKLHFADERVIHYGLIPRSHRCLFVINELPDLQARIQVALFNILQEGDIQIRGFKLRLPLDIQFIFTANPEDYTNRGSIVTPLKDRIESQIITHYPQSIEIGKTITAQEARIFETVKNTVTVPELIKDLVEQIAIEARNSEFIDKKSGVSARLTISIMENLMSWAERRMLLNDEKRTVLRLSDFTAAIPAITGKVELVYEGEMEGPEAIANMLIGKAIKTLLPQYLPQPDKEKKRKDQTKNPYKTVTDFFAEGQTLSLSTSATNKDYKAQLSTVPGLKALCKNASANEEAQLLLMELALFGLAEHSQINKQFQAGIIAFNDMLDSLFSGADEEDYGYFEDK